MRLSGASVGWGWGVGLGTGGMAKVSGRVAGQPSSEPSFSSRVTNLFMAPSGASPHVLRMTGLRQPKMSPICHRDPYCERWEKEAGD